MVKRFIHFQKGFTLVEVLVATGLLVIVLAGLVGLFVYCSMLSELSGDMTTVMSELQGKWEEIRNHDYDLIVTDYSSGGTPGNTFDLTQVNAKGVIYIDATNPDILVVKIVASWQTRSDRIMGEDQNLNGVLDAGEDQNGNGEIDSSTSIESMITKR